MSNHTPGPMEVREPFKGKVSGPAVWTKNGMLLAQMAGLAAFDYANAHLFAAAPDLLAALEIAESSMSSGFGRHDALAVVRDAIGKARGEPPCRDGTG